MMKVPKTTKIEKQYFRFTLIQAGKVPVELGWRGAIGRNGKKAKKLNVFVSFRPMPLSLRSRFLCLVDRKRKRLLGTIKPKPKKQLVYPIMLRAKKKNWYFYRESLGQVAWWWIKEKKRKRRPKIEWCEPVVLRTLENMIYTSKPNVSLIPFVNVVIWIGLWNTENIVP